jgi:hypothetical protein
MNEFIGLDVAHAGDVCHLLVQGKAVAEIRFLGGSILNERALREALQDCYEPAWVDECDACDAKESRFTLAGIALNALIEKHPAIYEDAAELAGIICADEASA